MNADGDAPLNHFVQALDAIGKVFNNRRRCGQRVATAENKLTQAVAVRRGFGLAEHVVYFVVADAAGRYVAIFKIAVATQAAAVIGNSQQSLIAVFLNPAGVLHGLFGQLKGVPTFGAGVAKLGGARAGRVPTAGRRGRW